MQMFWKQFGKMEATVMDSFMGVFWWKYWPVQLQAKTDLERNMWFKNWTERMVIFQQNEYCSEKQTLHHCQVLVDDKPFQECELNLS